jgi:hypothetical protein
MEPSKPHVFDGTFRDWHMDIHNTHLTDSIKTTNALFKKVRMRGQVITDEVLCELEIASLTANFGTN